METQIDGPPCRHDPLLAKEGEWDESYCRFCWRWINFPTYRERMRRPVGMPVVYPLPGPEHPLQAVANATVIPLPVARPGLFRRATNFLTAVWQHFRSGAKRASRKERSRRLALCVACENYDPDKKMCKVCGCGIRDEASMIDKIGWAEQHCPTGKW
jgi:hypothetical protein